MLYGCIGLCGKKATAGQEKLCVELKTSFLRSGVKVESEDRFGGYCLGSYFAGLDRRQREDHDLVLLENSGN